MRAILKGQEPQKLRKYRCQPGAVYDGPLFTLKKSLDKDDSVKGKIREQLLIEQGWLCAYCMVQISEQDMKVEHWHCQDKYPGEQLDYKNMLGVCKGNEGKSLEQQTCDTRKGNKELKYNPANPSHNIESQIIFLGTGEIQAHDAEFDRQLEDVLNLKKKNNPYLASRRKEVWNEVHDLLSKVPGNRSRAEIQKLLNLWSKPDKDGRLKPYCAVAIYYLRKRLKASTQTQTSK